MHSKPLPRPYGPHIVLHGGLTCRIVLNFSPQAARAPTRHRPEWLSSVQQLGIASYLGVQLELHTETAVENVEDVCSVILRPQRACLRTPGGLVTAGLSPWSWP